MCANERTLNALCRNYICMYTLNDSDRTRFRMEESTCIMAQIDQMCMHGVCMRKIERERDRDHRFNINFPHICIGQIF